jgi:hypothetical protein
MLVLLNIQLESVTGAADHRVVGFKLKQAFLGHLWGALHIWRNVEFFDMWSTPADWRF